VNASAKPEGNNKNNESNEPSENPEEETETIQGLISENGDKDDADQVNVLYPLKDQGFMVTKPPIRSIIS